MEHELFSRNIEYLKILLGLTYADITRYTAIPQPTMQSYDKRGISPSLTGATQIAEFYCIDLQSLCNSEILLNLETQASLQKKFIQRAGGISDTDKYLARLNEQLRSFPVVSRKELYKLISSVYREIIQQLNDENKFVVIPKRNEYAKHFTKNFHDLHTNLNVSYRTMSKPLDMSIGNLTRLEKGGEPMLNTVIKLADYFGVSITALISASPNFDYKRISKTFSPKQPPKRINDISSEKLSKQNHFYKELLSPANIQKEIGQFF